MCRCLCVPRRTVGSLQPDHGDEPIQERQGALWCIRDILCCHGRPHCCHAVQLSLWYGSSCSFVGNCIRLTAFSEPWEAGITKRVVFPKWSHVCLRNTRILSEFIHQACSPSCLIYSVWLPSKLVACLISEPETSSFTLISLCVHLICLWFLWLRQSMLICSGLYLLHLPRRLISLGLTHVLWFIVNSFDFRQCPLLRNASFDIICLSVFVFDWCLLSLVSGCFLSLLFCSCHFRWVHAIFCNSCSPPFRVGC